MQNFLKTKIGKSILLIFTSKMARIRNIAKSSSIPTPARVSEIIPGKNGIPRRHRRVIRDNLNGITKSDIRRLARRGGVRRISGLAYVETRGCLVYFLRRIIGTAIVYAEHGHRKTVTVYDVIHALKRDGRILYGFDDPLPKPAPKRKRYPVTNYTWDRLNKKVVSTAIVPTASVPTASVPTEVQIHCTPPRID